MPTILKLRSDRYEVKPGLTVRDAMMKHDIRPEEVIPIRDGELISEDEIIREGETIRLVPVISGGGVFDVPWVRREGCPPIDSAQVIATTGVGKSRCSTGC